MAPVGGPKCPRALMEIPCCNNTSHQIYWKKIKPYFVMWIWSKIFPETFPVRFLFSLNHSQTTLVNFFLIRQVVDDSRFVSVHLFVLTTFYIKVCRLCRTGSEMFLKDEVCVSGCSVESGWFEMGECLNMLISLLYSRWKDVTWVACPNLSIPWVQGEF